MIDQQERYHNYILRRSREDREEMNTTTNIYVVHTYNKNNNSSVNKFLGVYSSKELADVAGKEQCEIWGDGNLHYTVTLSALDDIINGEQK
ncbi:hypothetical protein N9E09_00430 [bacterium]|jgi:hypothetical protein|nr:hypothetical protein [bacterium]